jgi:hypothetical protein
MQPIMPSFGVIDPRQAPSALRHPCRNAAPGGAPAGDDPETSETDVHGDPDAPG